ncbi:MAG: RIP metalloprotease RseP [Planctomycetes bacterium]|nr:RIP metalloprotease RseP [Planctomycetota bacterium]MCB9904016.1 RIP metalloprotease RseP [Planctomycetota bacterium]
MDLLNLARILQVIFGVGLVIFVHELGHFLAARRCGVRVEVFSLGFGPRLLSWTRGATTYQIAAVPLGGYVKMAGEEPDGEPRPPASDELGSKTVGQRFLIFAGGVIMNVVFAVVVFPLILLAGVPFDEPTIGATLPGSVAWQAGIEPGTRVHSVNGRTTRTFSDIGSAVALSSDDTIELEIQRPGSDAIERVELVAHYDPAIGVRQLGAGPSIQQGPDGTPLSVDPRGVAAEAGMRSGDKLVSVDSDRPEFPLREQFLAAAGDGAPVRIEVDRDGTRLPFELVPEPVEGEDPKLGVAPLARGISALRSNPLVESTGLMVGDELLAIGDRTFLDLRLLDDLLLEVGAPLRLQVLRDGETLELTGPTLTRADAIELSKSVALTQKRDDALVFVAKGSAAEAAGMRSGDEIDSIEGAEVDDFEGIVEQTNAAIAKSAVVRVTVKRQVAGGEPEFLDLEVAAKPPVGYDYGISFLPATYVYQEKNPVRAVQVGMVFCWTFLEDTWRTLRGIAVRDVSGKNVGGIITIGVVAHDFANSGWAKLFFFLCVLSMNLAFLNILPVPLLDGGHLFFLLIEKLKGSPVSERVMGYSQLVGLVMILSLFVYVMHNDIQRFILR